MVAIDANRLTEDGKLRLRVFHWTNNTQNDRRNPPDIGIKTPRTSFVVPYPRNPKQEIKLGWHDYVLDHKFLFDNQFNTEATEDSENGYRLFDNVVYRTSSRSSTAWGHWLHPDDKVALDLLRAQRHKCGFCGYQTDQPWTTDFWCHQCIKSRYLERDQIHLLQLKPISRDHNHRDKVKVPTALMQLWAQGQTEIIEKDKQELLKRKRKAVKKAEREYEIFKDLADRGLRIDKLGIVYYDHTDTLQFAAIEDITESDVTSIHTRMGDFDLCPWSINKEKIRRTA